MASDWLDTVAPAMSRGIVGSPVLNDVVFYPTAGGVVNVRAELRRPYEAQLGAESNEAVLSLPYDAILGLELHGATVGYKGQTWTVINVEPDGEGWVTFQLHAADSP